MLHLCIIDEGIKSITRLNYVVPLILENEKINIPKQKQYAKFLYENTILIWSSHCKSKQPIKVDIYNFINALLQHCCGGNFAWTGRILLETINNHFKMHQTCTNSWCQIWLLSTHPHQEQKMCKSRMPKHGPIGDYIRPSFTLKHMQHTSLVIYYYHCSLQ